MNKPWRITFTGIGPECSTDLDALRVADSRIEFAMLYSESRQGTGRYPSPEWIHQTIDRFGGHRIALHLCGRIVQKLIRGETVLPMMPAVDRVQLNGRFETSDMPYLRQLVSSVGGNTQIIIQFDGNEDLCQGDPGFFNHILFDASGGRGIPRMRWPTPIRGFLCGYAGGLAAHNLRTELPRIAAAADGAPYWIDMESSLRDANDKFSVDIAMRTLDVILEAEAKL